MYFYKGFNENVCTFASSGGVAAGQPVQVCANYTVTTAPENGEFHGVAIISRNDAVSVQLTGYVELPYSGTAPAVGTVALAADGNGGVMASSDGKEYLVINVDTINKTIGFML